MSATRTEMPYPPIMKSNPNRSPKENAMTSMNLSAPKTSKPGRRNVNVVRIGRFVLTRHAHNEQVLSHRFHRHTWINERTYYVSVLNTLTGRFEYFNTMSEAKDAVEAIA